MPKKEPDEQYTPRGEKIPIPKREEFMANLDKVIEVGKPGKLRPSRASRTPSENRPT